MIKQIPIEVLCPACKTLKILSSMQWFCCPECGTPTSEIIHGKLERSRAQVKQITTGTLCHLEAAMIDHALAGWEIGELDFLFIENVGNLVCPSSYDLGENLRLVLPSVTEGEDKPLKYRAIFNSADAAVITKMDLVWGKYKIILDIFYRELRSFLQ